MPSTAPIRDLILDALDRLGRPFTEDVIDDAFWMIENTPELRARHNALCESHRQVVVNTWGGWWIGRVVERRGLREVKAQKSKLIGQYSKLDQPLPPKAKSRKVQLDVAGQQVFDYYLANKSQMPEKEKIAKMRDEITAMVAEGIPVVEAFAVAIDLLSKRPAGG